MGTNNIANTRSLAGELFAQGSGPTQARRRRRHAAAPTPPPPPPPPPAPPSSRFHVLVNFQSNFGAGRIYTPNTQAAAAQHSVGIGGSAQFVAELLRGETGYLGVGLSVSYSTFMTTSPLQNSSYGQLSVVGLVEGALHVGPADIGIQLGLGRDSLAGESVDIGMPQTARFTHGSDGALGLELTAFGAFIHRSIRVGATLHLSPGTYFLESTTGRIPLTRDLTAGLALGWDIPQSLGL